MDCIETGPLDFHHEFTIPVEDWLDNRHPDFEGRLNRLMEAVATVSKLAWWSGPRSLPRVAYNPLSDDGGDGCYFVIKNDDSGIAFLVGHDIAWIGEAIDARDGNTRDSCILSRRNRTAS